MKNRTIIFLTAVLVYFGCNDPYENSIYKVYDVNPVSAYLETRDSEFSEWIAIMKYADLYNALNQATKTFTAFIPDNDAVRAFYQSKGVNSIEELGKEFAYNLVSFHVIADSIGLDVFIAGGKLEKRTLSDDYLTVTFDESSEEGGGFNSIYINKEARIKETAISVSNGYVYVLESVLSPLVENLYERLEAKGVGFSIFREALDLTGWGDSLKIVYDEVRKPSGVIQKVKRDYTLFAVSDSAFSADHILSLADLKTALHCSDEQYDHVENELNLYVAYHLLKGSYAVFDLTNFENGAKKKIWGTLAESVMEISAEDDGKYYINHLGGDSVSAVLFREEDISDIPAKNGMLHVVDGATPPWQSEIPVTVYFDFVNYPEIATYIKEHGVEGQIYQTMHESSEFRTELTDMSCYTVELGPSGPKTVAEFNYVDYFTVKSGSNWSACMNYDMLILNLGYMGSISMKTPILIKGKYKVTLQFGYATTMDFIKTQSSGSNGGQMQFSFDNDNNINPSVYASVSDKTLNVYKTVLYEELEFTKTASHNLKMVIMDPAASTHEKFRIYLDYLLFEPIIEE